MRPTRKYTKLYNCVRTAGTLDPCKQRKIIYAIRWELNTERKCDCVIFRVLFTGRNRAKCVNVKVFRS